MKTKFVADDGTEFDDQALCLAYEKLIEASKTGAFHQTVESLFAGCTSYESGRYDDDPTYPVLNLRSERDMAKFKANLVQALPKLKVQLDAALALGAVKS